MTITLKALKRNQVSHFIFFFYLGFCLVQVSFLSFNSRLINQNTLLNIGQKYIENYLLQYHTTEMKQKEFDLVYNNGVVSLK